MIKKDYLPAAGISLPRRINKFRKVVDHMKKICCLSAALALTCGMVSCGSKKPDGVYYMTGIVNGSWTDYADDLDDALQDDISNKISAYSIEFDGDEAEIKTVEGSIHTTYFCEYEIDSKTGEFTLDYQSMETDRNGETVKVNASDDGDGIVEQERITKLNVLSDGGGMPRYSAPWVSFSDKMNDLSFLPQFVKYGSDPGSIAEDCPATLYYMENVLCTELYGVELDGKYKPGKEFTLEFDQLEVYKHGPMADASKDSLDQREEIIEFQYHCDRTDSTIEFEDGEWTWYNHNGDVLNYGEYQESEEYEGLIAMYTTDKSKKILENFYTEMPILLYIADDGNVYYPAFVKEK